MLLIKKSGPLDFRFPVTLTPVRHASEGNVPRRAPLRIKDSPHASVFSLEHATVFDLLHTAHIFRRLLEKWPVMQAICACRGFTDFLTNDFLESQRCAYRRLTYVDRRINICAVYRTKIDGSRV
jgi:hypothetical protein